MTSQLSFFISLSTSLIGVPRANNGFSKLISIIFPPRLTSQALFGIACTSFSVPLCIDLYCQLRLLWIQRQLDYLNKLVDHRTLMYGIHKRKLDKILATKEEVRRDGEQWQKDRQDLESVMEFVLNDRELPHYPDDKDDDVVRLLVWNQQDKEIERMFSEIKAFRKEIEAKIDWVEKASEELNSSTDTEETEVKRMQDKVSRLLA
ncbi:hypothetical protein BT96DRAFT_554846 [Gymnopus androsaceus JB14]|uniref:Uncharacterized protein n=1 Tax=Gymnopus androsaceus JB14 TaxID=1447944 RepID=A0A6A4I0G1_9AGAR|nr:hypothetical protein BT96DRAFT_554846 [Gymnopus androsaceus JB14]